MIEQSKLLECFRYNSDGTFTVKKGSKQRKIGDVVKGFSHNRGYVRAFIFGEHILMHRLVFLYHYGYLPEVIDHIDGDKLNNKVENLREVTISQNIMNSKLRCDSSTGVKGVTLTKRGSYEAYINVNRKRFSLGTYKTLEVAKECIEFARELAHGKFANHGQKGCYEAP